MNHQQFARRAHGPGGTCHRARQRDARQESGARRRRGTAGPWPGDRARAGRLRLRRLGRRVRVWRAGEKKTQFVYAIGRIGVSFVSQARRDSIWRIVNGGREAT